MLPPSLPLAILAAAVLLLASPSSAVSFRCSSPAHCQSYLDYRPTTNATVTLAAVRSLFQLRAFRSLLAVNSLPLSTPSSFPISASIRVPFPCSCSSSSSYGLAAGGQKPVYSVRAGDSLDSIARNVFAGLITYQDIAAANNISNPNLVSVGKQLWIPLPCSCDDVEGEKVVHFAHVVEAGSSVDGLAKEFGVKGETLMRLNDIANASSLKAGQVLDVPLRVCSSLIASNSLDYGIKATNGSYIITANNCVICSCSSSTWQLDCHPTQGISTTTCPAANCGGLNLGNTSSSSVCESATCSYAGYTNTTTFTILTNLTTQALCSTVGAPLPHPSSASVLDLRSNWAKLLVVCIVHMVFCTFQLC